MNVVHVYVVLTCSTNAGINVECPREVLSVCFRSGERGRVRGSEEESGGMLDIPSFTNASLESSFKNQKEKKK